MFVHAAGMIEYWTGSDYTFPQDAVTFQLKLDTDLYAMAKAKTSSKSLEISKDGSQFATFSTDRQDGPPPLGKCFAAHHSLCYVSPENKVTAKVTCTVSCMLLSAIL